MERGNKWNAENKLQLNLYTEFLENFKIVKKIFSKKFKLLRLKIFQNNFLIYIVI